MPDDCQTKIRIRLLGGLEVEGPDGAPIEISGRKNKALLAVLALSPGFTTLRNRLISLLWSDRGEEQARSSLRQALVSLRRAFGEDCADVLIADRDQVGLRAGCISVDAVEFDRLAKNGEAARAASLYRGPLLDGLEVRDEAFDEWAQGEGRRLVEYAIDVHESLVQDAQAGERVDHARRLVALDPFREASHRLLMEALAAAGERDQALRQYETLRETLDRGLDAKPSRESEALRERIAAGESTATIDPPTTDSLSAQVPSVAVLPFNSLSDDAEQAYFADGISADIINELGRFSELLVTAPSSSFRLREQGLDGKEIAEKLAVAYLVEGTVRRDGSRVRVTVQLVEAGSGNRVWGERYDRDLSDIFALQDEIAGNVATAVVGGVRRLGASRARQRPTENLGAYDLVLRALESINNSYLGYSEAAPFLEKAISLDPFYAQAHAFLSVCLLVQFFYDNDPASLDKSLAAARRAFSLDPYDARSHTAVGHALIFCGRLDEAQRHLDKAVEINPNDPWIRMVRGLCHIYRGNVEHALADIDEETRRNPFPPDWFWDVRGMVLTASGRYEEALASYDQSVEVPYWGYYYMAICHCELGNEEQARGAVAKARDMRPSSSLSLFFTGEPYEDEGTIARFREALSKSGLPE